MGSSAPDSDESRIEQILGQWFELQMAGAEPQLDELAKDAPHLIGRVRAMLERQGELLGPVEAAASHRPLPVDKLGDYELKSRIGSGGMGDVYVAREVGLDRMVAIKVLRQELAEDRLRRLRFKREATLTAALDHPGIVPIYGTGEDEGYVYLVMKLLPGMALDRVPGPWQPREVAAIGAQVARALHAAHEVEIVHRDIKPGNIQVDGDKAWVLDFGLARGRVDLTLTAHGEAPGTLAYMPPEQLRGSPGGLDPRGDVYSLGATLYQSVAGCPPFEADSPELLVRQALLHDPKPLEVAAADRDFWTIVQRALEKDPERRFDSALAFAEDLERFLSGDPIESRPPSTLTRCVKLARRYRTVTAALMAAVLVVLAMIPKLWLDARERAADLVRQLDAVEEFLGDSAPVLALSRLRDLEARPDAGDHSRFRSLTELTRATLMRDALLDRIQLDCVYRQSAVDEEFSVAFAALPDELRADPQTLIAWLFLAREQGDAGGASRLLEELAATGACSRLVAAWRAVGVGEDVAGALSGTSAGGSPVTDHVFTAVLLRNIDAPSELVRREIRAATALDTEHPRARLMQVVSYLIGGESKRAAELLELLVDANRPRVEVQAVLALLANVMGDPDRALGHITKARAALRASERPRNRWVELQVTLQLILAGRLKDAEIALASARTAFGDDEWLRFAEAQLLIAGNKMAEARELLGKLMGTAAVPWNRRRAAGAALQIDFTSDAALTLPQIEALIARAEQLADEAASVNDNDAVAEAMMMRAYLAEVLQDAFAARPNPDQASHWQETYLDSLLQALRAVDLRQDATLLGAEYVVHRLDDLDGGGGDALVIGDLAAQMRRRAITLTRRGYSHQASVARLPSLAALGALLSAHVKDRPVALEVGSIANALLEDAVMDAADEALTRSWLEQALAKLQVDEWPAAPPRPRSLK